MNQHNMLLLVLVVVGGTPSMRQWKLEAIHFLM
jgi:hypothetical protein